jgi:hypothetical protein
VIDGSRLESDSGLMTGMQTNPGIRSRFFYGTLQLDHVSLRISKSLFKHSQENKPAFARKVKEKILWSFRIFSNPHLVHMDSYQPPTFMQNSYGCFAT